MKKILFIFLVLQTTFVISSETNKINISEIVYAWFKNSVNSYNLLTKSRLLYCCKYISSENADEKKIFQENYELLSNDAKKSLDELIEILKNHKDISFNDFCIFLEFDIKLRELESERSRYFQGSTLKFNLLKLNDECYE